MDYTLDEAIAFLVNASIEEMKSDLGKTKVCLQTVTENFWKEYQAIPEDFVWDSYRNRLVFPDRDYSQDKRDLYDRYWEVALRCKEIKENISNTGYGSAEDIFKMWIYRMANKMEWNFPFGWGNKHRKRKETK